MFTDADRFWMQKALQLAKKAEHLGEVPVGAVLVLDQQMIGEGWNCPISTCDPTAHAEMMALRSAAEKIGNYRLVNSTLYVTLEPCLMCMGAMVHARIQKLIYAAADTKSVHMKNKLELIEHPLLNHRFEILPGLCAKESSELLNIFFQNKR